MAEVETNNTQTQNTETQVPESTGGNTQSTTQTQDNEAIFAKLDEILAKRNAGIAKSALKDNGFKDDEISDLCAQYRARNESAKNQASEKITALQTQNAALNKKLFNIELSKEAAKAAAEIGMNPDRVDYALKNVDTTTMAPDGKIDNQKVKEALQKVLDEIPEFKLSSNGNEGSANTQSSGVRKIGAENSETNTSDAMAKFKKALGLKEDK